jgi:hypothetical protein
MSALYAAWKGALNDSRIWWATSTDGVNWSGQNSVPNAQTSHGPALVVFERRLYMFWKEAEDNVGISWSVLIDGKIWASPQEAPTPLDNLPRFETSESPAAAVFDGRLQLFWKGANDLDIWHAEASSFVVDGHIGLHWLNEEGFGGFTEPGTGGALDVTRNAPAALAAQRLYVAGQNANDDGIFVLSRPPGQGWTFDRGWDSVPGAATSNGPALTLNATTFVGEPDKLLLFWKGRDTDQGIYHAASSDAGQNWTPQRPVQNVATSHRPALANRGERTYALWKGSGHDDGLYWAYFSTFTGTDITVWLDPTTDRPVQPGQRNIPMVGTTHRPALAVFET